MTKGTTYTLEVNPRLPRQLVRLEELANNLLYSWDRPTRLLFSRLDSRLWSEVGHNPKAFLKRIEHEDAQIPAFDFILDKAVRRRDFGIPAAECRAVVVVA